jgi:signal transduction histidine kinase
MGRLNVVQRFSLLSLVCVVLLSIGLGFVATRIMTRDMLAWEWQVTAEIVRYQVRTLALERLFTDPGLRRQPERVRDALAPLLRLPDVVRVKVWDTDRAVVWSDDPRLIGRAFPDNRALAGALGGTVSVDLKETAVNPENVYERERFATLAEIYVPIPSAADPARIAGVLEVYRVPTALFARIQSARIAIWVICVAGGLVLYASLFWIFLMSYRGQRRLEASLTQTLGELRTKNAELDRLFAEAQDALARLKEAQERLVRGETLRALGELAAGAAHHLNNLLAVAIGRVELLRDRVLETPDARHTLEVIDRALTDAGEVVRRVQAFSRRQPIEERRPLRVEDVAAEVLELTRARWKDEAETRGLRIEATLAVEPTPPVLANAAALREVMTNLVLNAVDALPGGGRITIRTFPAADFACMSVADTGVGMSEDVRRRALEPFFTTKGVRSTGLGLSVSYGIVKSHGGELDIASAEGQGTTVTIRLPADPEAGTVRRGAATPAPRAASSPRRVLVIDDEPEVLETLAAMVRRLGHQAVTAASGRDGLTLLHAGEPVDLVLTDFGMPEMTGLDVMRELAARRPGLPVVIVTGWAESMQLQDDAVPAKRLLPKPVTLEALRGAIAAALGAGVG